ncbi:MAG: DUF4404 family protein [Cyanobacteria bacterium J06614_10]
MSKEDIRQSIAALHAEIDRLDTPDTTVKEKLVSLIESVEKQLQEPENAGHKASALNSLPNLIEQLEADHPKVTDTLGRLLTTLSGMGV